MASYGKGTVLTCEHEDCGCRIHIVEECHCPSGEKSYTCACGTPMVALAEVSSTTGDTD